MPDTYASLMPDQQPQGWSDIANNYEKAFEGITSQLSQAALNKLSPQPGERLLDVAAGTGSFSLPAARSGADVLATDFAPGMIARLRERIEQQKLNNIQAKVMDGQSLDIADHEFDVSASIVGIIFFPDIHKGITELKRVLHPGGRSAIVCWNFPETSEIMSSLAQAISTALPDFEMPSTPPVWARLVGKEQLSKSMRDAGYKNVEVSLLTGELKIDTPQGFWNDFAGSAPPLQKLFEQLGTDNTNKVGKEFVRIVQKKSTGESLVLKAEACLGIGFA